MRRQRRHFSGPDKIAILREHLIDRAPVSEIYEKHGLNPTLFYHCKRKLFAVRDSSGGATGDHTVRCGQEIASAVPRYRPLQRSFLKG